MKKLSILLLVFIMLFSVASTAYASEIYNHNDIYSIELPEGYEYYEDYSTEENPVFIKNDGITNINIGHVENTDKVSYVDLTEEDLAAYKSALKTSVATEYAKQGEADAKITIISVEAKKLNNGYTALSATIKSDFSSGTLYQKMYQFAGTDYLYTIAVTSQRQKELLALDKAIDSFKMTEAELLVSESVTEEVESQSSFISTVVFIIILASVIIAIIANNKKQKKKEQAQLTAPIQSIFDTQQSKQIQDELKNYNYYNNTDFQ